MCKVRRFGLLLGVFVLGMSLGALNSQLLAILGIPLFLVFVMVYDEASYTRKNIRSRRMINE
ncbi:hypothetical protein [Vagococcus fluvialis]|uniref:hypothetical protein n=1 Tax=Vagococcus fluvialis TaxID=2738 RepID=UPI001D0B632A|nr:hypothetical protein [Vagococcus fluvialis]UDM73289.1 hypothetical protein K5K99_10160 [Vagococcus fluvialis]